LIRANLLAGVRLPRPAIVDAAAGRGVEVVRLHLARHTPQASGLLNEAPGGCRSWQHNIKRTGSAVESRFFPTNKKWRKAFTHERS
jgi:hypothetical protein